MRSVIAVVQSKGGVGKTTISICLAGELHQRGYRVSVIDADPQRSAVRWAELGQLPFPVRELSFQAAKATAWARNLQTIDDDFAIIDTAPNEYSLEAAVVMSTLVLVPCTPSGLDLETTIQALNFIDAMRSRLRVKIPVLLVPNRVDSRTLEGMQILDELHQLAGHVAPTLGSRSAFIRAFSAGQTVSQFAAGTPAHREVQALADAVLQTLDRSSSNNPSLELSA